MDPPAVPREGDHERGVLAAGRAAAAKEGSQKWGAQVVVKRRMCDYDSERCFVGLSCAGQLG